MNTDAASPRARPRVLLLSPYFLPAEQGGGSVRAVLYLGHHLRPSFDLVIATRDHDLRSQAPFAEADRIAARQHTSLDIRYLPPGWRGALTLRRLLFEPFDLIYLNSLMAPDLALLPLLWLSGRSRRTPVLIAPRGELMPGALSQRPLAKKVYLGLLQAMGLLRHARFHATSPDESTAIATAFGARAVIHLAPDLPPPAAPLGVDVGDAARLPGPLRVLFLSRIDRIKNLGFALDVLARSPVAVDFDIAGPVGDEALWSECQERMRRLPAQIRTRYLGAVPHAQVGGLLATHDLLFLPTLGENHGYVVLEALAAGCPVLLSDQTPWRGLQGLGIGADLPLDDTTAFVQALVNQDAMSDAERHAQRSRCRTHAGELLRGSAAAIDATRAMLESVAQPKARMPSTSAGQSGG